MEFPGDLVLRIPQFHCHGLGSIPGRGTEIPRAACPPPQKKIPKHTYLILAFYSINNWTKIREYGLSYLSFEIT